MSYLVLARKYRPQSFHEVVGQRHVTQTLGNAIESGRVAHAILLSGPRGTGKTTVARILAKAMNCAEGPVSTPCNECRSCREITSGHAADVYEIDGASNNSVDQIRDLRENVKYMPSHSRYKIYIIDEVHMLSLSAFNALLKTLEEPPSHVLFFFATTESHKIPVTILSRCQRHDFRRIDLPDLVDRMAAVCREEKRDVDDESLTLIAREGAGSLRDALSLLDQLMASLPDPIRSDAVSAVLGLADRETLFDLAGAVLSQDLAAVLEAVDRIYDHGHDLKKWYTEILEHFRQLLIVRISENPSALVDCTQGELDRLQEQAALVEPERLAQMVRLLFQEESAIRFSQQPRYALEVAFIRMMQVPPSLSIDTLVEKLDALRAEVARGGSSVSKRSEEPPVEGPVAPRAPSAVLEDPKTEMEESLEAAWERLLEAAADRHPSLAPLLSKATLSLAEDGHVNVAVNGSGFSVKMVQKNKRALQALCREFMDREVDLLPGKSNSPAQERRRHSRDRSRKKKKALSDPLVAEALDVFQGTIVDIKVP